MKYLFLIFLFVLSGISSCTKGGPAAAHDPIWGKETCAHCRMILSEKRFAAQWNEDSGKTYYYDDLGCAIAHAHAHDLDLHKLSVRPHPHDQWIVADKARFEEGLTTPMNSGFGAVAEGGTLSFSELILKLENKKDTKASHGH